MYIFRVPDQTDPTRVHVIKLGLFHGSYNQENKGVQMFSAFEECSLLEAWSYYRKFRFSPIR